MGATQALGMAEAVADGDIDLDRALDHHLLTNHFPPLPSGTLELAKEVIDLCNAGDYGETVDISDIGEHARYGTDVPASECAEAWHLDAFIEWGE